MKNWQRFALCLLAVGLMLSVRENVRHYMERDTAEAVDTARCVEIDTALYRKPVVRDSVVVRYVAVRLPVSKPRIESRRDSVRVPETGELGTRSEDVYPKDSVWVHVPITQKRYEDSTYTAYVSGYMAELDSISVYQRRETMTITRTVTSYKRKRWGLGLHVGYGINLAAGKPQVAPYIGLGVQYNLISF